MKRLLVLRHAKARPDSPSGNDFDRPLASRGHRESAAVGRQMRASDQKVDVIVASPAQRVIDTVANIVEGAGWIVAPVWDSELYNASLETLLGTICEIDDAVGGALIVGHNPGLQQLVMHLAEDDRAGLRDQVGAGFPTAALAELALSIDHWGEVRPGCGHILSLVRPNDRQQAPASPD